MEARSSTLAAADAGLPSPSAEVATAQRSADLVLGRLEDQLGWYERRARRSKQGYQSLKLIQIVIAAAIPVIAALDGSAALAGVLGGVIVVLEAVQQLFQFQQNWIRYRATAEGLK